MPLFSMVYIPIPHQTHPIFHLKSIEIAAACPEQKICIEHQLLSGHEFIVVGLRIEI